LRFLNKFQGYQSKFQRNIFVLLNTIFNGNVTSNLSNTMGLRPLLKLGKLRGYLKSLFSVAKRLDPPKSPDKLGGFDSGSPLFKGGSISAKIQPTTFKTTSYATAYYLRKKSICY
jgi:hypothetical protein